MVTSEGEEPSKLNNITQIVWIKQTVANINKIFAALFNLDNVTKTFIVNLFKISHPKLNIRK